MPRTKNEIVNHLDAVGDSVRGAVYELRAGVLQFPPGISPTEQEAERIRANLRDCARDIDALTAVVRRCDIP